jgi:hypothetical protein
VVDTGRGPTAEEAAAGGTRVTGTCPDTRERCRCKHAPGHAGPHECECLGSWNDDGYVLHWPEIVQDGPRKGERVDWVARGVVPPTPYYEP